MFGLKGRTVTDTKVDLPDGYDDRESFWYVAPEHRDAYAAIGDDDLRAASRHRFPAIRESLAESLRDQERERVRAEKVAEYAKRYELDERKARQYLSNVRGTVLLEPAEEMRIHQDYTPATGFGWPDDAEQRVRHLYRRQTAAENVRRSKMHADNLERNRCPMCGEVDPSMRLSTAHPLRGLVRDGGPGGMSGPGVTCCDACADVIRYEAAQLRAALVVDGADGVTVRDRARELIAAYIPLLVESAGIDVPTPPNTLEALLERAKR